MKYFTPDFLDFFKELAANNEKEWFDANRKRYVESVKEPFERFVTDLIAEVGKVDKRVQITHKDAIFRINRDIRFSKDKSPYKLGRSAIISPIGKKDKGNPGLYIELTPEHFRIYGGVYMPDKDQLEDIRYAIAAAPDKLKKLMDDMEFKKIFGEVRGEKNKILPKDLKDVAEKAPIIYNKQFYWFTQMAPETILKNDLLEGTMRAYAANKPLMDYFSKAMHG